jgi:hypothetical protein
MITGLFGINVWFASCLAWYNRSIDPKGWDDSNRLDDREYRAELTKLAAWAQPNLSFSPDGLIIRSFGQSSR